MGLFYIQGTLVPKNRQNKWSCKDEGSCLGPGTIQGFYI